VSINQVNEINEVEPKTPFQTADEILDAQKGKFPLVLVLAVDSGNRVHINSNVTSFQTVQWLLNKAAFEVQLHEREEFIRSQNAKVLETGGENE